MYKDDYNIYITVEFKEQHKKGSSMIRVKKEFEDIDMFDLKKNLEIAANESWCDLAEYLERRDG